MHGVSLSVDRSRPMRMWTTASSLWCLLLLVFHAAASDIALETAMITPLDIDETSIAAGVEHSCAIYTKSYDDVGGRVLCWGLDNSGQSSPPPGQFIQVSTGRLHTCALRIDETIECWGSGAPVLRPNGLFEQVSSGDFHACGVLKDKSVQCWGRFIERTEWKVCASELWQRLHLCLVD